MSTELYFAELLLRDGEKKLLPMEAKKEENRVILSLSKDLIPRDFVSLRLVPVLFQAKVGDAGYFVLPRSGSGALAYFTDKKDGEERMDASFLAFFGMKAPGSAKLLLMRGMANGCEFVLSLHDGVYALYPEIKATFSDIYEDVSFELYFLTDEADYSSMARLVRERLIALGDIRPLVEKAKERPLLSYMAASPEVRIRMGWKPAPPEILEQTRENEPPMHVACTFDRVGELIDELKKQGVEKAEICLVGWNKSGHDGRWPEMFPVEPLLGGEEGLKRLVRKAEEAG
ncbi:MAG: DUF5696 domain-containing protein, partial [Clostridia bacterium]|nr:DUF5696 domain-containing protein [Clostridia bacterium]